MTLRVWALVWPVMLLSAAGGCRPTRSVAAFMDMPAPGTPAAGQPAPDFSLPDQNGRPVRLTDLQGRWVVLYFYSADDTPACICNATEFTELLFRFKNMNALVYGVSDDSPEVHRAFIKKFELGFDLLSDPGHGVMRKYGAWVEGKKGDESGGRVHRTTYLIGPRGTIRHHWRDVVAKGHAEQVRQKLLELQRGE